MAVFLTNFFLIIAEGKILQKNRKKLYIILVTIQCVVIAGIRAVSVGSDTIRYWIALNYAKNNSFEQIFRQSKAMMFEEDFSARSSLFTLVLKVFGIFTGYNFRILLFASMALFMMGLGRFLYRYSSDICLSYILFLSFYFEWCYTAMKQMLAVAILCFWGFDYIRDRKLSKFLLVQIVAMFFHLTSIVFLPFYFIYNVRQNRNMDIAYVAMCIISYFFADKILVILTAHGAYNGYNLIMMTEARNLFILLFSVILFGIAMKWESDIRQKDGYQNIYASALSAVEISSFFLLAALTNSSFQRLSYYYFPFLFLLLPQFLQKIKSEQRKFVSLILYGILLILFVARPERHMYEFFWEEAQNIIS